MTKPIKLKYPTVPIAMDGIIVKNKKIVLIKSKHEPFKHLYTLPGGFVEIGERVKHALIREMKEETGLKVKPTKIVGIYDDPKRDPRGHTVSISFLCKPIRGKLKASSDARKVELFSIQEIKRLKLGFDHKKMLKDSGVIK